MIMIEQDPTHISFYEATLTSIAHKNSSVGLSLEDVHVADAQRNVEIVVEGIDAVLRDGLPVADLRIEMEDGEVLTLRQEGGQVLLAVEWNDFSARRQETVVYTL